MAIKEENNSPRRLTVLSFHFLSRLSPLERPKTLITRLSGTGKRGKKTCVEAFIGVGERCFKTVDGCLLLNCRDVMIHRATQCAWVGMLISLRQLFLGVLWVTFYLGGFSGSFRNFEKWFVGPKTLLLLIIGLKGFYMISSDSIKNTISQWITDSCDRPKFIVNRLCHYFAKCYSKIAQVKSYI